MGEYEPSTLGEVAAAFQSQRQEIVQRQKEWAADMLGSIIKSDDSDRLLPVAALLQAIMTGEFDSFLAQNEHAEVPLTGMVPEEMMERLPGMDEDLSGEQLKPLPCPQSPSGVASSELGQVLPLVDEGKPELQEGTSGLPLAASVDLEAQTVVHEPVFEPADEEGYEEAAGDEKKEGNELWDNWIAVVQVPGTQGGQHWVPLQAVYGVAEYKNEKVAGSNLSPHNAPEIQVEKGRRGVLDLSVRNKYGATQKFVRSTDVKVFLDVLWQRGRLDEEKMREVVDAAGDANSSDDERAAVVPATFADADEVIYPPLQDTQSTRPSIPPVSIGKRGEPASQESDDRQDTLKDELVDLLRQGNIFDSPETVAVWVVNNMQINLVKIKSKEDYWVNVTGLDQKDIVNKDKPFHGIYVSMRPQRLGLSPKNAAELRLLRDDRNDVYLSLTDFVDFLTDMKNQGYMIDEQQLEESSINEY